MELSEKQKDYIKKLLEEQCNNTRIKKCTKKCSECIINDIYKIIK